MKRRNFLAVLLAAPLARLFKTQSKSVVIGDPSVAFYMPGSGLIPGHLVRAAQSGNQIAYEPLYYLRPMNYSDHNTFPAGDPKDWQPNTIGQRINTEE